MQYLKRGKEQNQISEVTKHQPVDIDALLKSLDQMQSNEERKEYLATWCPCLYIFVLKKRGMEEELKAYDEKCKSYENDKDSSKYSLYVHGHWFKYLRKLVEEGLLKQGKTKS